MIEQRTFSLHQITEAVSQAVKDTHGGLPEKPWYIPAYVETAVYKAEEAAGTFWEAGAVGSTDYQTVHKTGIILRADFNKAYDAFHSAAILDELREMATADTNTGRIVRKYGTITGEVVDNAEASLFQPEGVPPRNQ